MTHLKHTMLYALLPILLLLAGCTEEQELSGDESSRGKAVNLNLDTRALGTADEQINTLRIFLVRRSIDAPILSNQFIQNPSIPLTVPARSGDYDIYVVANETNNMQALPALQNAARLADLRAVKLPYDPTKRIATHLPMMGMVEKVKLGLSATPGGNATVQVDGVDQGGKLPIELVRLAVKIDLRLRGKSFSVPQKVVFKNLPNAVPLFEDVPYEPAAASATSVTVNSLMDITAEPGYIWNQTATDIILPTYTLAAASTNAAVMEVTLDNTKTISTPIGHSVKIDPKDYSLKRNTLYTLVGNVAAEQLTTTTTFAPWSNQAQDFPAGGGSFWNAQPNSIRVGLDGTVAECTATFTATCATNASVSYQWYRRRQLNDMSYVTEELIDGQDDVTLSTGAGNSSLLSIQTSKLDDAGEIHCIATTTAPDGRTETLQSGYATLMVVGTEIDAAGTYPDMQTWIPPRGALLGSTCLLTDNRDNKVYRVKLMADGNWWMIQDLAYGNASSEADFMKNADEKGITNLIEIGSYGVCMKATLPTGGYLYNNFAAIQLPQGTAQDISNSVALSIEYIRSLCPEGWHLPGNQNGVYNEEWVILQKSLKMSGDDTADFEMFSLFNAAHLNAYNRVLLYDTAGNDKEVAAFLGGYIGGRIQGRITFCSLGFAATDYHHGAIQTIGDAFNDPTPIRCIRNFK